MLIKISDKKVSKSHILNIDLSLFSVFSINANNQSILSYIIYNTMDMKIKFYSFNI